MKILILILGLTLSSFSLATTYQCNVQGYRFDLESADMMTTLVIRDRRSGEFVINAIVDEVRYDRDRQIFIFQDLILTFKTLDIQNESEQLIGLVDGTFGRGQLRQSLKCMKTDT